jgi:asparagine synthase (glutamine-hydrolysing)
MCGIAGFIGNKLISETRVNKTLDIMKNRGPNFSKQLCYEFSNKLRVNLLHSRLSIIDLNERSNQPLQIENDIIIYNGEIYNARELMLNLKQRNIELKTKSDTEILLKYYQLYGENCVNYFEGMWSFAIFNIKTKKLFLSRDRFGEKPLFYYKNKDGIFFGSETKFIRCLSGENFEINKKRINAFLTFGYKKLFKNNETYFKNIESLPKSSNLIIDDKINILSKKYWSPKLEINNKLTTDEASKKIKDLLIKSTELRMRSDVPISFCLSGGVDSGALASIAVKKLNRKISTFSIIDKDERYNEKNNIDKVVYDLKTDHKHIDLNKNSFLKDLEKLTLYHDSPVLTLSQFIHSKLMESMSSNNIKVAISGAAADEIFTGYYDHFLLHLHYIKKENNFNLNLELWKKKILPLIRNEKLKNPNLYIEDEKLRDHIFDGYLDNSQNLINPEQYQFNEEDYKTNLFTNRRLNELFQEITPGILHNDDLNAMSYSIENRSPFLDKDLVNFCFSIPPDLLIQKGYGKYLLRNSMKDILIDEVRLDYHKKGFNCSIDSLLDFSNPQIFDYFMEDSEIFEYVKRDQIEQLIINTKKNNRLSKFLFTFLTCKQFLDNYERY